jgi:glycosyltransferase involved in cell wall biosynthesis
MRDAAARPVRVLIFEPYPMGKVGGNLRTLSYLVAHIDRTRFELVVVSPMETEFIARLRAGGTECVVVEPPASVGRYGGKVLRDGWFGGLRNALDLLRYNQALARVVRARKIDVIYCNSIRALLSIGLAAKLTRTPVLWYIKGELNNPTLDRIGFAMADRIFFFCASNRDDKYPSLVRRHQRKIGVLKIGIDPADVLAVERRDKSAAARDIGLDSARVNTIVLGQLYRPKGVHFALEALASLVGDHPEVMLYIVGDPVLDEYAPYRDELESIVTRHGLERHVRFTGWRTDALDILAQMDIVIHPSLSEGFGRAVLESMALSRPVIASRVGGLREIIKDGVNGFLVDPGDTAAIATRWRQLLASADLREQFGREAKRAVFAEYLLDDKVTQMTDAWGELAAGRS